MSIANVREKRVCRKTTASGELGRIITIPNLIVPNCKTKRRGERDERDTGFIVM